MTEACEDFDVWTPAVLVIDDETRVRSVLRRDFEGLGFRVYRAENGLEGVRLYRETPGIDLVLIDLTMPGLDGPQTLHELHRIGGERGRAVRACFLGTHERCDVEALMALGAELVLGKPEGLGGIARIAAELLSVAGGGAACDATTESGFCETVGDPAGYDRSGEGSPFAASSGPPLPGGIVAGLGVFGDRFFGDCLFGDCLVPHAGREPMPVLSGRAFAVRPAAQTATIEGGSKAGGVCLASL